MYYKESGDEADYYNRDTSIEILGIIRKNIFKRKNKLKGSSKVLQ